MTTREPDTRSKATPIKREYGFDRAYFEKRLADCAPMHLLDKVCRDENGEIDCAVICGMYRPIANDLRKLDHEFRVAYSRTWSCHNHARRACRGNALVQGGAVVRAIEALDEQEMK